MIRWNDKELRRAIEGQISINLDRAAEFLQGDIQRAFPGSGGPIGKLGVSKKYRESHRSKPGEIPHVQSGDLKRSIRWQRDGKDKRRIGSTLRGSPHSYAFYLEFGTRRMAPRPYMRPAMARNRTRLARILVGGMA